MTVSMQFDECENDALAAAAAASSCARWLLRSAAWSRAHFELGHFLQKKPEVTSIFMAAKKGDVPLVSPEELAGTFVGNGCVCSPECIRLKVSPACCGGICVLKCEHHPHTSHSHSATPCAVHSPAPSSLICVCTCPVPLR
eukprot:COSAG01_NODE_2340_length_7871_cov_32.734431_8_plen_141_part_00